MRKYNTTVSNYNRLMDTTMNDVNYYHYKQHVFTRRQRKRTKSTIKKRTGSSRLQKIKRSSRPATPSQLQAINRNAMN